MKHSKSSYLDYSSPKTVSNSLAIREAISKISLSPDEAVKYLRGEPSIWSNSNDEAINCALTVLVKLYRQLKTQLYDTEEMVSPETLLRFLSKNHQDTVGDVIIKYCGPQKLKSKRRTWKQLKIADRDSPRSVRPVPANVPPLDAQEFISGWSDDDHKQADEGDTSDSSGVYREPFDNGYGVDEEVLHQRQVSTSSSSSLSSSVDISTDPNKVALKEAEKAAKSVFKIVHKVDKAISPRSENSPLASERKLDTKSSERSEKVTSRYIPQSSKGIQTEFELPARPKTADVAISARLSARDSHIKSSSTVTTSLHQLLDKSSGETSTTATSSSLFASSLSAGEIPLHKVAALTAKSKYTVVTIRPDGSCASTVANFQAFKENSKFLAEFSPKTPTLMELRDELASYHNSSFAHLPPLKTSTPKRSSSTTTTFGVHKPFPRGTYWSNSSGGESAEGSSLKVHEYSIPTTVADRQEDAQRGEVQIEELTPKEVRDHFIRRHLEATSSAGERSLRSEEDESTLNQVSPLPSGE